MPGSILWLLAAAAFGIGEMLTMGLFLGPFALGALLAALADAIGVGGTGSWVVFVVVSLLTLGVLRPIARAHMKTPPHIRTGSAALIGKQAVVLERIVNDDAMGCVRIDGEVWTARAFDEDQVIEKGTRVQVMEIRGATALVSE